VAEVLMQLVESLRALLIEQLSELHDGEKRIARAISAWADMCSDPILQSALDTHAEETERHVTRIDEIFEVLDAAPLPRTGASVQRLIEGGVSQLKCAGANPVRRDEAIIAAARRVERYEISIYADAAARARLLELGQVVRLLEDTLHEERTMARTLMAVAQRRRNAQATDGEKTTCSVN
jgi:ferritin-like metal-binding protein YciE